MKGDKPKWITGKDGKPELAIGLQFVTTGLDDAGVAVMLQHVKTHAAVDLWLNGRLQEKQFQFALSAQQARLLAQALTAEADRSEKRAMN